LLADRRIVVLAFVVLVVLWGSSFSALKVGLEYAPPMLFAGIRSILGGLAMLLAAVAWGGSPKFRCDWPVFALLSALNVVFFLGLQTLAIMYLPSGSAAVLIYLQPILVGLLAWFFLGEALTGRKVFGLLLGFSGIAAVSAGGLLGDLPPGAALGVALGVGAALFWALGTVYFKKVQERVATLWAVAVPFFAGGVILTSLGLLVESPTEITLNTPFVASLLYSSLLGTAVAWLLWLALVRSGEASRVSAYIFFVPLVAVLIGAIFLDETLSPSRLVGAALVVAGIYLANGPQPAVGPQQSSKDKKRGS